MSALQGSAWGSIVKPDGRILVIERVRYRPDQWRISSEDAFNRGNIITLTRREIEALAQEVRLL